jgi:alanyl-tRNA synthetase
VGENNYNERGARIIADHLRTAVHMIADGVKPSNTDRGYVLRRLIRRAIREAHKMGHEDACLAQVARDFIHIYQDVYESVKNNETVIIDEITMEESKFQKTIGLGIKEFNKLKFLLELSAETKDHFIKSIQFHSLNEISIFPSSHTQIDNLEITLHHDLIYHGNSQYFKLW